MKKIYFLVFNNTFGAINAEKKLKEEDLSISIMPTPTQIARSCGISIIIQEEDLEKVKKIIIEKQLEIKGIYTKEENQYSAIL